MKVTIGVAASALRVCLFVELTDLEPLYCCNPTTHWITEQSQSLHSRPNLAPPPPSSSSNKVTLVQLSQVVRLTRAAGKG